MIRFRCFVCCLPLPLHGRRVCVLHRNQPLLGRNKTSQRQVNLQHQFCRSTWEVAAAAAAVVQLFCCGEHRLELCRHCCMAIAMQPPASCSGRTDSESLADNAPVPSRGNACERNAVRGHGSEIAGARRSITQPHGSSAVYRMRRPR